MTLLYNMKDRDARNLFIEIYPHLTKSDPPGLLSLLVCEMADLIERSDDKVDKLLVTLHGAGLLRHNRRPELNAEYYCPPIFGLWTGRNAIHKPVETPRHLFNEWGG
jgi:hypothetical protein